MTDTDALVHDGHTDGELTRDEAPAEPPDDSCLGRVPRALPPDPGQGPDPRRAHERDSRARGPVPSRERRPS